VHGRNAWSSPSTCGRRGSLPALWGRRGRAFV
jgi:hypothetical protein